MDTTVKPLFLVGYMGCGKSSLGRRLARRLGVALVDTDTLVEQQEGASVADVFRYEGEERFRELEREALERINATGIGPMGLGGRTTALAVHAAATPTHIAGLPVAVNLQCHACRHAERTL